MEKSDKIKAIISIIAILLLALVIVNLDSIIPNSPQVVAGPQVTRQAAGNENLDIDSSTCLGGYGVSQNTVIFVHADWCPHCANMKPIVQELELEGYNFYWAESSDSQAGEVTSNCLSDLVGGYIPQFICPKTGKEQTGEMSKENLRKFADECI